MSTASFSTNKGVTQDLMASIVVFLVALPLCMGIAIACNAPPIYGIISGMVGGMLVGIFTGSPFQVSGPAAGLTVLVLQFIEDFGIEMLGPVVLMSGLLQFIAGNLKLGQWFRAVSPPVIQGMLSGIGILIFASQFHIMLDDTPKGSSLKNLILIPHAIWKGLVPFEITTHHLAAFLGVLTISIIIGWQAWAPKKLKIIPAPLLAIMVATWIANGLDFQVHYVNLPSNILGALHWPPAILSHFDRLLEPEMLTAIISLAIIASAETLLCSAALDQMQTRARTDYNKELAAQGLGNIACGILGVLPISGVIVRSATNIQAGALSNKSTIFHGIWLFTLVILTPHTLRLIPVASLAAILVFTGFKLMNFKIIPKLLKHGRSEVAIFLITILVIIAEDLLTGVIVGFALSLIKLLYVFSHLEIKKVYDPEHNQMDMYLKGSATFIRVPLLASSLESIAPETAVTIHLDELMYVDHACLELLYNWENKHKAQGGRLVMDTPSLMTRTSKVKTWFVTILKLNNLLFTFKNHGCKERLLKKLLR